MRSPAVACPCAPTPRISSSDKGDIPEGSKGWDCDWGGESGDLFSWGITIIHLHPATLCCNLKNYLKQLQIFEEGSLCES